MARKKSLLERAARALCTAAGNPENITFEGKPMWQSYLSEARAVLVAIREPSEVMVSAGQDVASWKSNVGEAWHAMIDAALAENGSGEPV
ncbi:MAG TPA: hypothetical protein VF503_20525 [Sphingobium sp.]|uniref:hypothetical protein n=1 Tax=Sphingobium sp. TaxID=1912891 RepID=UPI002ED631FF